ncbi:DUF4861 domain-containing protein [Rufibacter sp. XAAS-G3-1]|uniref:DUF4861 domain-containing protein n=1 Tax=Rufibacter sp. XAAS-G3-1 TaxID=2729134 RepID=UPI0015E654E5|nr:DUF4861 domain-containing protein [Rufibacter sp. XAAS-G3-1]
MREKAQIRIISLFLVLAWLLARPLQAQNLTKEFPKAFTITVTNPLNQSREEAMVLVGEEQLRKAHKRFNTMAFVVMDGAAEIPSQYNHQDPRQAGIVLVLKSMQPRESRTLTVRYKSAGEVKRVYEKRTQAELSVKEGGQFQGKKYVGGKFQNVQALRVPAEHTDHSNYIRYEGPGWESDKVAYRYYLDWRNAVDVFGKRTQEMVLQNVGQQGLESYHNLQPWGMDIMKVANSLGVGSVATFHGGKAERVEKTDSTLVSITENGNLYSSVKTDYYGWQAAGQKVNLHSLLSIHAGTRLTRHQVQFTGGSLPNITTGLIRDTLAKVHKNKGNQHQFGYLASYGKQSLNKDKLGVAVLFKNQDFLEFTQDANSNVVTLKPTNRQAEYYYVAAWELEPNGIQTEAEFLGYLTKIGQELANPVTVRINKK